MNYPTRLATAFALLAAAAATAFAGPQDKPQKPKPPPGGDIAPLDPPIPADTKVQTTPSGLKISVIKSGKGGRKPKDGDLVRLHYIGWLSTGKMFQSSRERNKPLEMPVGRFVPGWNEAVQMMSVGDRWKVTIPPELGYGKRGSPPTIPANSTLVFDMELLAILSPEFVAPNPKAQHATKSGIKFEILAPGAGEKPAATDGVKYRFALWNKHGKLLQWTREAEKPLQATKDQFTVAFLKEALYMMKPGQRCRFEAPPQLVFGDRDSGPDLPPNSVTIWEIELLGVGKSKPDPKYAPLDPEKTVTTRTGLKYEVIKSGSGTEHPRMRQMVTVHYCGWLKDGGTRFDSSFGSGFETTFRLDQVVPGWTEGLKLMTPGAVYRFELPPRLAYGRGGKQPTIPPNATLIFHVELVRIGE